MKVFTTTLVKKAGKLDFNNDTIKKVYNQFVGVVPDGFTVNVIFELISLISMSQLMLSSALHNLL